MKVMIAYPALAGKGSPMLTQNRQFQWYHVGSYIYPVVAATAATLLAQRGFEAVWYDGIAEGRTPEHFWTELSARNPDVVVLESKTPVIRRHWEMVAEIKARFPSIFVVLIGDHVTALPRESMDNCPVDAVLTGGDYDFLLLALCEFLANEQPVDQLSAGIWLRRGKEVISTGEFRNDGDLNTLPFIDRQLTRASIYGEKWRRRTPFYYTMAGRDCHWGKCSFCAWTTLFPRFRAKSVTRFVDEIEYLVDHDGAQEIFDDTGTFPGGNWLQSFCKAMIDRGLHRRVLFSANFRFDLLRDPEVPKLMKKAGFRKIKVGLESANQATLDRLNKGIRVDDIATGCRNAARAGLDVHLTVMVGFPWETRAAAENTLQLARSLMAKGFAEMLQATVVVPYPGTPLHAQAKANGWFLFDPDAYERLDMSETVLRTPDMTPEEVMSYARKLYGSFLTPSFIARRLLAVRKPADIDYLFRGAKAVIGHILDFQRQKSRG